MPLKIYCRFNYLTQSLIWRSDLLFTYKSWLYDMVKRFLFHFKYPLHIFSNRDSIYGTN